jgi:chromosome segregation ATPase
MREKPEPRRRKVEVGAAVAGAVVLLVCAFSEVPRVNLTTPAARAAQERRQDRQALGEMRARNDALQTDMVRLARLLESTRTELAGLTQGYNALNAQAATTTARLQQFETTVQQANERMARFSESEALQKISTERDDAVNRAKESSDQVRQLTLKLQKAGVYP